jgi:XTP/dITP diphosphohydrolase
MRSRGEEGTLTGAKEVVYFATGNRWKYAEAARVAREYGIRLKQIRYDKLEIQSNSLEEIAAYAAQDAANVTGKPVVAEDAGLFVRSLDGFPGPYSSYVHKTIGYEGILTLMNRTKQRNAYFQAVVAFCEPGKSPNSFSGEVKGRLSLKAKGKHGFGFDPIFIPKHRNSRTFAELTIEEKNLFSHRAKAFSSFFKWFVERP